MSTTNAFAGQWSSLPTPLTPYILDVINSMGHTQMTPVQASTIPLFMKNKDVVVEAVTGSGKTLAFVIPTIERLLRRERRLRHTELGALIISPTRELASQIHSVFEQFLSTVPDPALNDNDVDFPRYPPPLLLVSSDSSPAQDVHRFLETGANIAIGTPGRVEEFLLGKGSDVVSVKELEVLVLDEADRLLDLGFTKSITKIISALPKQRRTGLFSATMTDALSELVRVGLRNPVRVVVKVESKKKFGRVAENTEERRVPATLQNFYITCDSSEKMTQLLRLLQSESSEQGLSRYIVYFATCACVDYFFRILPSLWSQASYYSLHGHIPPAKRTLSLCSFVSHPSTPDSPSVLLCTDVAARGLDLPDVDCVIQFDPPVDPKQFSHRCGRTARAGKNGRAWVLLNSKEEGYVDFMSVRKIPLKMRDPLLPQLSSPSAVIDSRSLLEQMRSVVRKDRDFYEKGAKAFVSFVQAYSRHEASYIFRKQDLDYVGIATSFGLLRLPRMPELKKIDKGDWQDDVIDWQDYSFADKTREVQRRATLTADKVEKSKDERAAQARKRIQQKERNDAWSKKFTKKQEKERKKEARVKKRQWVKAQAMSSTDTPGKEETLKRSQDEDGDDWDELAQEERMMKKVKRGQVDIGEFNQDFRGL